MKQSPSLFLLFRKFFQLGLTAFGGPAMVAYIRRAVVEKNRWLSRDDFDQGVAMAQTLPGMTAMQTTAYTGFRLAGFRGALVAFCGFVLPSFLMMLGVSEVYIQTRTRPESAFVLVALKAMVVAILANAAVLFWKSTVQTKWDILPVLGAATLNYLGVNPFLLILLLALSGLLVRKAGAKGLGFPPFIWRRSHWLPLAILASALAGFFAVLGWYSTPLFGLAGLMFKIDLVGFGGGFSSVPLMFHEVVAVRHWMEAPDFMAGIALGQVTPGPIAITATFVGHFLHGVPGAVVATVGILAPSFLLITGLIPFFDRLRASRWFKPLVTGILLSFVGLLLAVTVKFAFLVDWDFPLVILCLSAFVALRLKVPLPLVVLISLIFAAVWSLV